MLYEEKIITNMFKTYKASSHGVASVSRRPAMWRAISASSTAATESQLSDRLSAVKMWLGSALE